MFEFNHNNTLCLRVNHLYDGDVIMTKSAYNKLAQRQQIKVDTSTRPPLVEYNSIPNRFKAKIIQLLGNPHEVAKSYKFSDYLVHDQVAQDFYRGYEFSLPLKNINQYVAEAVILNAVKTVVNNTGIRKKTFGSSVLFDKLAEIIEALPQLEYPHKLPTNPRALKRKYKLYMAQGYESLIHKNFQNNNSEKVSEDAKLWILSRWADRVVKVANLNQLMFEYNELANKKGWKPLKNEDTLRNFLYKDQVKHLWYGHRHGDSYSKEKFTYKHSTKLPSMRDSLWYSDGTKMNYFYRDENGKVATCQVYEVMDVYSEVLLGYHISKTEDGDAQFSAYKMAIKCSEHKPYQIGFDGQGGHKKLQAGNFLNQVARLAIKTAPYNGNSKTIESAFNRFQSQFLKKDWFFTGQNITASTQESKANREFINANLASLPTLDEVKAIYAQRRKEWNEATHHASKLPRLEMYRASVNPETPKINLWDMVDLFWIERPKQVTCTSDGISFKEKGTEYMYCVHRADQLPDIDWLRKNVDRKFTIKYDPEDMSMIYLYEKDALGLRFVCEATTKVVVTRGKQEQENWENEFIQKVRILNQESRIQADEQMDSILEMHGALPEQYGLKSPSLLGLKSKRKKANNSIGQIQKRESNKVVISDDDDDYNIYNLM